MATTQTGDGTGPQQSVQGGRIETIGDADLPDSLKGLVVELNSLKGVLTNQVAANHALSAAIQDLAGKDDQTGRSISGAMPSGRGSHSRGNASLPQVKAVFQTPTGLQESGDQRNYRGTGASGSLPGQVPTVSGVRRHAARVISEKQWGPTLGSHYNPATQQIEPTILESDGKGGHQYRGLNDQEQANLPKLQRNERIGNALQGMAGRAVSGEGLPGLGELSSLLPEVAATPVGIAAAAVGAGYEGTKMIADQRAKNAQYQSIMGGSNISGLGQRMQEARFRFSNLGVLSGAQASEAFMGTTQMGMRGNERDSATSSIVENYKSMGMSVQQSLQAMSAEAQHGYTNLTQLTQSLKDVSNAAKDTGVNTAQARQNLINITSAVNSSLGASSPGSNAASAALAGTQAALGRNFQNVDFSGTVGQQQQLAMMARNGMSPNQFYSRAQRDPTFLATQAGSNLNQYVGQQNLGQVSSTTQNVIKAMGLKPQGANGQFSPEQQALIAQNAESGKYGAMPQVTTLQQAYAAGGLNLAPEQAGQYAVGNALGINPGEQAAAAAAKFKERNISAGQAGALRDDNSMIGPPGIMMPAGLFGISSGLQKAAKTAGINVGGVGNNSAADKLARSYLRGVGKTGKDDPVVDRMLRDQKKYGSQNYTVQTADGPKDVNFHDLITHYADQAQSGAVGIASGPDQGNTIAGQVGSTANPNAQAASASANKKFRGKDQTDKDKKSNDAKITISATPELKRFFNFLPGSNTSNPSSTALVPNPAQVTASSLPGVGGQ